jgi:hypothetical protein
VSHDLSEHIGVTVIKGWAKELKPNKAYSIAPCAACVTVENTLIGVDAQVGALPIIVERAEHEERATCVPR